MKNKIPNSWTLFDEFEGNFIFRNVAETMQVSISFDSHFEFPYCIDFQQLQGIFVLWAIEDGAYISHSSTEEEAFEKAIQMMDAIYIALESKTVVL